MATDSDLRLGETYYLVTFEDQTFVRPLIRTYEYIGRDIDRPTSEPNGHEYFSHIVDSEGDQVIFTQEQIWQVLNIAGLIEKLAAFRNGKVQ